MRTTEIEKRKRLMKLRQAKLRLEAPTSFSHFLGYSNPKYQLEWFHRVIAEHCQMLLEGKIKNLMVFVPPQHGKSEIISRNFPAWALGRDPDLKIASCSYSSDLSEQFSRSVQRIIESPSYQEIFPDTFLSSSKLAKDDPRTYIKNVDFFEIVGHEGFYKAVGVGGPLTGTPVDIAIIDDPVKDAKEAYSPTYREAVWNWYNTVLTTRLHNDSKQLFIMTRWHEDDLAGGRPCGPAAKFYSEQRGRSPYECGRAEPGGVRAAPALELCRWAAGRGLGPERLFEAGPCRAL